MERIGNFPMPVDLYITYKDGSREMINIPLRMMRGSKPSPDGVDFSVAEDWPWTHPEYVLTLDKKIEDIERLEIDSSRRMADVNPDNNIWTPTERTEESEENYSN